MRQKKILLMWITMLMLISLVSACTPAAPGGQDAGGLPLPVAVSIVPQQYFVQRIGGEHVVVDVLVPPGADPHTYEPKPEQMARLNDTAVYFSIGVDFEAAWLPRIAASNPDMVIVDTTKGIERIPMEGHHYGNEADHEHEEGGLDPHIWVSPSLVKIQSQAIYESLAELGPAHKADYQANLNTFLADIDTLDRDIRQTLENTTNRQFIVFHPAWGYFARDYGLEMVPVEVGGQEPSAAEMAEIVKVAREGNIRVIFAQPETSTRTAETIANEIGGEVLLIDPLAPDWMANLRQVADTFNKVLNRE